MTEQALLKVSKSVEDFTVDFHKNVSKEFVDGNLVSSALSAHTVLSMAALGADGKTAQKMREALYLSNDDDETCQGFKALIDSFNSAPNVTLRVANKMCVSDGIRIKEEFKGVTSRFFHSESIELDFSQIKKSAGIINQWCVESTEGKIEQIIEPENLGQCTGLILLNAVYFKGNWKEPFSESFRENRPFHIDKATTVDVPTMFIQDKFFYEELKAVNATCIALPYENEDLAMVIVIPKDIDGLEKVEKNLKKTEIDYENLNGNRRTMMNLMLPKFKISTTIDLTKSLNEMGFSIIFTDQSDFKNISDHPMKVESVVQKAYIEVNEEGTEAAAVTGISAIDRCAPRPPIDVDVDRPFLYRIVDIKHKVTLFSGHVVDPRCV